MDSRVRRSRSCPCLRASYSGVLTYVLSIACHSWLSGVFWRHMSEMHHPALLPCWSCTVRRARHSAFNAYDCVCVCLCPRPRRMGAHPSPHRPRPSHQGPPPFVHRQACCRMRA
ncbi:uncharacterized protein SCHCODRAFT_02554299, partial [Schizophyllum commune H4-8]|uniref:uncharacterized protein n=1 Tax=Schizophyllum commune (strain H4-8 / FGSC 9210) TaxID=578458 RepID=UPI002160E728